MVLYSHANSVKNPSIDVKIETRTEYFSQMRPCNMWKDLYPWTTEVTEEEKLFVILRIQLPTVCRGENRMKPGIRRGAKSWVIIKWQRIHTHWGGSKGKGFWVVGRYTNTCSFLLCFLPLLVKLKSFAIFVDYLSVAIIPAIVMGLHSFSHSNKYLE